MDRWFSDDEDYDYDYDASDEDISPANLEIKRLIAHMFLPKRTPQNDDLEQTEENMLAYVSSSFRKVMECSNFVQLTPVQDMLDKWVQVQPKSINDRKRSEVLMTTIETLEVGNTIPIYVRQQNCTMMISKVAMDGKEKVRVQTFRAALPSKLIMSNVDPLNMNFPESSNLIENERMLSSKIFSSRIYEMATEKSWTSDRSYLGYYAGAQDVPDPFMVLECAVGFLVPREDPTCSSITKKIRDQVTMKSSGSNPFRRSGMWMSIKVALQLKIFEVLGNNETTARLVYKIVMLHILTDVCQSYGEDKDGFDLDLASQMLAKVGRRVEKLQRMSCRNGSGNLEMIPVQVELMRSTILEYSSEILTSLNKTVQQIWNKVAFPHESKFQPIRRSNKDFINDLYHQLIPVDEFLDKARKQLEKSVASEDVKIKAVKNRTKTAVEKMKKRRFTTLDSFQGKKAKYRDSDEEEQLRIMVYDMEHFIKEIKDDHSYTSEQVFNLGRRYIADASYAYKDNPVGFSQILLVSLKITNILDKMATGKHPILLEYKPEICAPSFDCLLLPHEHDVDLLNELLDYFSSRDEQSTWPILERKIHDNTLSVRYAENNEEMSNRKDQIKSDIDEAVQEKFQELEGVREECQALERQMSDLGRSPKCICEYGEETYKHKGRDKRVKTYICPLCTIKSKLDSTRTSVKVYEVPFPPEHEYLSQNAVVFELLIPPELSHLRQFLAVLKYELLGEPILGENGNEVIKIRKHWLDYCKERPVPSYKSGRTTNLITLGSSVLPSSAQNSKKSPVLNVSTTPNESFIVENGMNCFFHYAKKGIGEPIESFIGQCTFSLKKTANSGSYISLQKYLDSIGHSQNEVIANQSDCDEKLSLDEYMSFGSLRAGHRTQLRNLYRAISNRSLSLDREPILALILQTIWQVGPRDTHGIRDAHLDFKENDFALQFLDLLEELVKAKSQNYSTPLILLTAIFITGRIMELNENCRYKCYQLLRKWRELTKVWSTKIKEDLMIGASDEMKASMQNILHQIHICSMMTYNVYCSKQWSNVCKDDDDMSHLLDTIYSKNLLENKSFPGFMGVFGLMEQMVPAKLKLDEHIVIGKEFQGKGGLKRFIEEKFPAARQYANYEITMASNNIIMVQFANDYIIVLSTITGELLINGYPETELSSEISGNKEFRRFFQKHLKFRVQRKSNDVYRTSDSVHGKHYEFKRIAKPSESKSKKKKSSYYQDSYELYIIELQENQPSLILVPHELFRGFVSDHFIDNYTHWLDPAKECIYFRRIAVNERDYDLPHEYILRMEKDGRILHDEINKQFLLSIKSNGFMQLTQALSRLEFAKHINVFMNNERSIVGAHLPRHNLRFTLQPNGLLGSLEYPGFEFSLGQDCTGTFVGLENGLLLKNGAKRIIIMPHGTIQMSDKKSLKNGHQRCRINLNESLSQPSFFIYEFDDVLKRIQAKKSVSSWLYLAALHGATSSSQTDPFTGVTGTERALYILQSANVWSCAPYDKESLEILKFIKGLSPIRSYYKHWGYGYGVRKNDSKEEIETIEWPQGLPSMAACDGYAILVKDLIQDSARLEKLHPIRDNCVQLYDELRKPKYSEKLLVRSYLRNLDKYNDEVSLNENVMERLDSNLFQTREYLLVSQSENQETNLDVAPLLTTAYIGHLRQNSLYMALNGIELEKNSLAQFLLSSKLMQPNQDWTPDLSLETLFRLDFNSFWLRFYHLATSKTKIVDNEEFTSLLCVLAYRGIPLEQVNILHCIRTLVDSGVLMGNFPPVLELPMAVDPSRYDYDEIELAQILKRYSRYFPKSYSDFNNDYKAYATAEKAYRAQIDFDSARIAKRWKSQFWPCEEISRDEIEILLAANIKETAFEEANRRIRTWFYARKLRKFVETVQEKLNECVDAISATPFIKQQQLSPPYLKHINSAVHSQKKEMSSISLTSLMNLDGRRFKDLIMNAQEIVRLASCEAEQTEDWISSLKQACEAKIKTIEDAIHQSISKTVGHRILQISGLSTRLNPAHLLRNLLKPDSKVRELHQLVLSLCVLWTHLKRLNRCLHFQQLGKHAELATELQNPGHENWSPMDHPEWLLIELELDITIRKVQVEVANQMIHMPDDGNGVMQLNMGEGKTSVIVPMLCSILVKEDTLCRVTVLSSMFKMNWDILKFAIGGILNQRLYSFPCKRDAKIDEACISNIQAAYEECMKRKGVVLTLPEHRLSFRSLAYDKILKKDTSLGLKLLQVEDWLRWHARDILDESDELLSVKYQLVYTIGDQIDVDGGDVRWMVCQKILDILQDIVPNFLETHGTTQIEYDHDKAIQHPYEFCPIRLIAAKENEEFFENLESFVTEKFLAGVTLPDSKMKLVTEFILNKDLSTDAHENAISLLSKDPMLLNRILILAGYIRRGVLRLSLSKRWKVEYGVDQKGFRRMAVPFRAKDVAAEKTEFGHPDLAIILTHLSYYYSGLSDTELNEVFTILAKKLDPGSLYSLWIQQIPDDLVEPSLTDYHSLNLMDTFQKDSLFGLIRRHKMVVNFWLSHVVFPKESKQFPGKLAMTASDLVYERQRLPITGFSGTNDSIVLLPLTINQQDLSHLQGTNERMEQTLLEPENSGHKALVMGVTCEDILMQIKEDNLRILIDSGALMLELDNEQIAQRWLEIDPRIEAAVYFNKDNELMVKPRSSGTQKNNGQGGRTGSHKIPDIPFELSPFHDKLQSCGVFLDDQHTRGTDLKFPHGSKACVTIGSRMKREKLIQACMRMRKLENGHTVVFYLSREASNKVVSTGGGLSTSSVLNWVKHNTKESNGDGLLYWSIASKNYAQRLAAEDIFHFPNWKSPFHAKCYNEVAKANILAEQCVDQEITTLMDMYGQHSKLDLMTNLISKWFEYSKKKLIQLNGSNLPPPEIMSRFDAIHQAVRARCHQHVPQKRLLSSSAIMDEEQEKELELEKEAEAEEERKVERPPKVVPAEPSLHPNVVRMVLYGESFGVTDGVMRLSDIFKDTTFAGEVRANEWAVEVFATNDFISVIDPSYDKQYKADSYLRPMEYFVSNEILYGTAQILFLSPYEVNELLPRIRNHESAQERPLHMFATRKFEKQDMLFNLPRLQLPPAAIDSVGEKFRILESGSREMAALLLASGSLYFNNQREQEAFAKFLSFVPKPWTKKVRQLFESGIITPSGFLVPEFRQKQNTIPRGFTKDPMGMVKKILMCRHPVLSDVAHVVRLLNEKTYIRLKKKGDDESDEET